MRSRTWALVLAVLLVGCGGSAHQARTTASTVGVTEQTSPTATPMTVAPTTAASTTTTPPAGPVRFVTPYEKLATPEALAGDIAAAEAIATEPTQPAAERAKAGRRAQMRYRQLADTPAWDAPVEAALPSARRTDTRRIVEANRNLLAMFKTFPDTMPPWEIVDPAPPDVLLRHYRDAQAAIGVDWTLLAGVNFVETKMGRIRGFSTAGARGPMQFIPSSWERFGAGGNIDDDRDAIFAAARHLKASGGAPFDPDKALYGYNHSDKYVAAVKAYAAVMAGNPEMYPSLHAWETVYRTPLADLLLVKGYRETTRFPVADYLKRPAVTAAP
jgi:hypothetical protein